MTSTSAADVVAYGWDAASNLVLESHTNDTSTSQPRDGFAVVREVDAANELVRSVKTDTGVRHPNVEVTAFTYDVRGNRVSETTREGASFWSHVTEQDDVHV